MALVMGNGNHETAQCAGQSSRPKFATVDSAELRAGPTMGHGLYLVVRGPMPAGNGDIRLQPALNEATPEFRQIEVAWTQQAQRRGSLARDVNRYEKSIPLSGLAGTKGVELVSANGTRRFVLTGH